MKTKPIRRQFSNLAIMVASLVCLPSRAEHFHFHFEHSYEGPWQWDEITLTHESGTRDGVMFDSYRGTAIVTGCDGLNAELSIPAQISHSWTVYNEDTPGDRTPVYEFDYRVDVVEIGSRAFASKTNLVSVTIPGSVTNIGDYAFSGCSGLTSLTIPDGVENIGIHAFSGCSGLIDICIPNSVENIGSKAFYNCSAVDSVVIPGRFRVKEVLSSSYDRITSAAVSPGSTSINGTFFECVNLQSVAIPGSVTNIGDSAFHGCYRLPSITIPGSVSNIGDHAFYGCYGLTSITIPDGVTNIGDHAFRNCYRHNSWESVGLQSVSIPHSVTNIGQGAFQDDELLQSIVLPDGVMRIADYAFSNCRFMESITIPSTVSEVGDHAFQRCDHLGLTRINLLDVCAWATNTINSKLVGTRYLMVDGNKLNRYVLPEGTKTVEPYAFKGCCIDEIVVPDGVEIIGSHAFEECHMSVFSLPNSVTNIGDYAFSGMGLNYLGSQPGPFVIPDSVVHIGDYAFSSWTFTDDLHIPTGLKTIGSGVFSNCGRAGSFTIPQGVESIGDHAFSGCDWCWEIAIPNTVTNIGWSAFAENHSLSSITLSPGVMAIADSTFYDCTSLERISIPPAVTNIGTQAFYNCTSLESVEIDPGLKSIGSYAFYGCSGLTAVHISDLAAWLGISYDAYDSNPLFHAHHLYLNGTEITELAIPEGTTRIAPFAFAGGSSFQSISIPDSVTNIGSSAFSGCSGLTELVLPERLRIIKGSMFRNCTGLTTVVIPSSTTDIERGAFSGCSSLESIVIPYGVGTIGDYAFYGCSSLKELAIPASVTNIFIVDDAVFNGCDSLETISISSRFRETITFPSNCEVFFYDPLVMRGNSMPSGSEGSPYSATIPTTGGGREIRWTVSSGALPDGLVLDAATGVISGSPSRQGTFSFQIAASDEFGQNAARDFSMRIEAALQFLTDGRLPSATAGVPYGQPIEVVGGVQPLSYELVDSGSFPTWASNYDLTGNSHVLSGTPRNDDRGTFSFTLRITDAQGAVVERMFSVDVCSPPLLISTDATLPAVVADRSYWQVLTATGGVEPYAWEIVDLNGWPNWLSSNSVGGGYLQGWPSEYDIGIYSFTLRVTDAEGTSLEKTFSIEVQEDPNHAPVIESWLPAAERFRLDPGATTNLSVVASDPDGDELTYSWSIYDEDWNQLENGVSTGASYAFSRAVGEEGTNFVRVCVSDGSRDAYRSWTILVQEKTPLAIVTDATLPVALTDDSYWQPVVATGGEEPYAWEIVDVDSWPSWLRTDYFDYWDDWGYDNPYLSSDWCPSEDDIGTHTFALRVTDAEGSNVVKTFTLEVQENPNPPPVIDSYSPDHGSIRLEPGTTQTFSVEAHDPKGDPISFYWYVYDPEGERLYRSESGGETNEFSWTFDAAVTGTYEVSVEVADGSHSSYCYWYVAAAIPKTIYVDQASTADDPDGTSWETACPTLAEAAIEAGAGDTVLVAPGVYAEADVYFRAGVTLRSRDGAATTILDGEGSHLCVNYLNGDEGGFFLDGFTLRNGSNGGNWYPAAVPGGSRLDNCVVANCVGTEWHGVLQGSELVNCIVRNCRATGYAWDGVIVECDLENCVVAGNESEESNVICGSRLWNCSVARNTAGEWYYALAVDCAAWNSIVCDNVNSWGNTEYDFDVRAYFGGMLEMTALTNCCVAGLERIEAFLEGEGHVVDFAAQGCIEADPKFVDAANGDFRLRAGSPCIDAGAAAFVRGETDVAGFARVQGAAVDLGAHEGAVDGFVLSVRVIGTGTVSPATAVVPAGGSATFTASESAGRPFQGWTVGGADAGSAATYTWSDVQADGELVATFGSFSFCVDVATGDDANGGLSWEAPKATIQAAVDASADGESVLVKPGVYGPLHAGDKAIRIESTGGKAVTIVDGGGTNRCAYLGSSAGKGATLAGFTLRNGNADWHASPKAGYGGGAYGGTLLDCDVTGCEAYEEGGGIAYAEAHRCRIVGNGIFDGDSYAYGGGAADGTLYSCLVASNVVSLALGTQDTSATALGGGTAWCSLFQCTIVDNTVEIVGDTTGVDLSIGAGGALYGSNSGNIVFGNTAGGVSSDVENWDGPLDAPGSLVGVDPLFVDRAHGDYRLREDSPAVDVGATDVEEWRNAAMTYTDLDGNPRVRGRGIDLGCYESAWSAERTATVTTPEPVPYDWLERHSLVGTAGFESAAFGMASNRVNKVWECYVAGISPTNATARFEARIEIENGVPVVKWSPDLNEGGTRNERVYTVEGQERLGDGWGPTNVTSRFFRVKVAMPQE